jgi:TonB-linked SusC/RagA family outer membrane protein
MRKSFMLTFVLLFALIGGVFAQQGRILTGNVTSADDGLPLPGVTVTVEGTTIGTITDVDGNYTLTLPPDAQYLNFSFVGMRTIQTVITEQTTYNAIMVVDDLQLDEVVVTALGISRETKSLGYNVGKVDGDDLTMVPQENVMNSLAGRVSGVVINSTGGPGSSVSMVIRGASSLTSDNQPLFVVDGIPMNNTVNNVTEMARDAKVDYGNAISDINPEDIESISVLKGPSAAALYGSRAGNGVVLITTKSGKRSNGIGVTITSNTVIETPYKYLEKHTKFANGRRPYTQDNRPNNGLPYYNVPGGDSYWVGPELDKGMMAYQWPFFDDNGDLVATELVSHPDNWKNFFQTGYTTTNGVSITNATEKLNYRLSYNNMQNKGVIPNSDMHRNSLSLNTTVNLLDNLSVTTSLNYSGTGADNRPAGNRGANPMQALYEMNPHLDVLEMQNYWEEGKRRNSTKKPL